jgi:recombination protein RecT
MMNDKLVVKKEETIFDLIEKSKTQMALAIPNSMSVDRLARVFVTELRKNPKLMACDKMSLMSCLMTTAQLGLEVGVIGQSYLVPFGKECTLIVGFKGLVALALRSGNVKSMSAACVYEDDEFDFQLGTESFLKHKPKLDGSGKMIAVYAVVKLSDGTSQFDVMSIQEVEDIKKRSKTSGSGPWVTDYPEMAKKTIVRRFCKMLPVSTEAQEFAAQDELVDYGIRKAHKEAINVESKSIDDIVFGNNEIKKAADEEFSK